MTPCLTCLIWFTAVYWDRATCKQVKYSSSGSNSLSNLIYPWTPTSYLPSASLWIWYTHEFILRYKCIIKSEALYKWNPMSSIAHSKRYLHATLLIGLNHETLDKVRRNIFLGVDTFGPLLYPQMALHISSLSRRTQFCHLCAVDLILAHFICMVALNSSVSRAGIDSSWAYSRSNYTFCGFHIAASPAFFFSYNTSSFPRWFFLI